MMGVSFDNGVGFDILGISSICYISDMYDQSLDILLEFKFVKLTAMPTLWRFARYRFFLGAYNLILSVAGGQNRKD